MMRSQYLQLAVGKALRREVTEKKESSHVSVLNEQKKIADSLMS